MQMTKSAATVLVVDDDPDILELVATRLGLAGYRAVRASTTDEALRAFFSSRPDLALLDVDMPGLGGIGLCERIREVSDMPVIFLTALGAEADRVRGLRSGADDYVVKPFSKDELLARIAAVLRRTAAHHPGRQQFVYSDGEVEVDDISHTVRVRGKPVSLSPLEYRVLQALVRHAGQVLSQEQLQSMAWGRDGEDSSPDSVRLYISYLRGKIEENPRQPRLIETVREFGYRYVRPQARGQVALAA
jgi:two-component system KDP operon response regulator KdpE